ncbi:MAG: type IX secretion system sortase PorU, partial [Muribaculaceae bacterium]|nr:type IX secretion system sortase PorU [Muribaculaceae bacterium]
TVSLLVSVQASALNASYYATQSVLNNGKWVKIKVNSNGMHRITYDQLRQWGFSTPENVNVYGFSVPRISDHTTTESMPDDLPMTAVYHAENSLLFYAEADCSVDVVPGRQPSVKRNLGDRAGYYFLREDAAPSSLRVIDEKTASEETPLNTHTSCIYIEPEEDNPVHMGALFYSNPIGTQGRVFNLPFRDWTTETEARLYYNYVGTTESTVNGPDITFGDGVKLAGHTAGILTNNRLISPYNAYNQSSTGVMRINKENENLHEVKLTFARPSNSDISYFALDNLSMQYTRDNSLWGLSELVMNCDGATGRRVAIKDATAGTQVWNITNRFDIGSYATTYDGSASTVEIVLAKDEASALIAFNPEATFPAPEYVGTVENQDLHSIATPDMVIITLKNLLPQAEKIAALHKQYQGYDVAVIDQEEIFNEFSSGARSVDGYRRFMKMLYDRDRSKLKYLLLLGPASFDNRGLYIDATDNLMTYPAERPDHACNTSVCYTSDGFFGMLDDGFQLSNITTRTLNVPVGRIPTSDVTKIEAYINKIGNYFEEAPIDGSYNKAFILTCDGDENSHLLQGNALSNIINKADGAVNVVKGFMALYKNTNGVPKTLKKIYAEEFARGQGFFVYAGHGGSGGLGQLLSVLDVPKLTFGASPLVMLLSCEANVFDTESNDITREFLFTKAGPANVIAAGRSIYQSCNIIYGEAIARNYYNTGAACVGDVFIRAHNQTSSEGDSQRKNNLCFDLMGDPALPIYRPVDKVVVNTVNEESISAESPLEVIPLEPVKVAGVINRPDGTVDADFNGDMFVSLFYSPKTVKSLTSAGDPESVDVKVEDQILGIYSAKVVNGEWEATIVAPEPIAAGSSNKLTFFARSTDRVAASGVEMAAIAVNATRADGQTADTTPPVIEEMYLNTKAFIDGSVVGDNNTLVAKILPDESGINFSSSIIGGATRLVLDGNHTYADVTGAMSYNSDGSITLSYNLSGMAEGKHNLELMVTDNAGNHATRNLSFVTMNNVAVNLIADTYVARESVELSLDHNLNVEDFTGRIYVETASGETVFTKDECSFPFEWDVKDNNGKPLADGTYRVYATVKSGGLLTSTPRTFVTVIAPR